MKLINAKTQKKINSIAKRMNKLGLGDYDSLKNRLENDFIENQVTKFKNSIKS